MVVIVPGREASSRELELRMLEVFIDFPVTLFHGLSIDLCHRVAFQVLFKALNDLY